jgi:hypothetical protein
VEDTGDRRRLMRIQLDTPIIARVESARVALLDLSAEGARIAHVFPLARGKEISLEFEYDGRSVSVVSEVVRCTVDRYRQRVTYCSGIRFSDADPASLDTLRDIIADAVARDFEARSQHMRALTAEG